MVQRLKAEGHENVSVPKAWEVILTATFNRAETLQGGRRIAAHQTMGGNLRVLFRWFKI
jgi:hypothetical protein